MKTSLSLLTWVGFVLCCRGAAAQDLGTCLQDAYNKYTAFLQVDLGVEADCEQQYSQIYAQCQISASDSYNECEYDNIVFGEGTDTYDYCPGYYDWDLAICESNLENSLESCQEDKVMNDQAGYMLLVVTQNACYATYQ